MRDVTHSRLFAALPNRSKPEDTSRIGSGPVYQYKIHTRMPERKYANFNFK